MDKIHRHSFKYLENNIIEHQKQLARLEKGEKELSDDQFRDKHRQLFESMDAFQNEFLKFKRLVFKYAKDTKLAL